MAQNLINLLDNPITALRNVSSSLDFKDLLLTNLILITAVLIGQNLVNQSVYGQLEEELELTTKLVRENTRSTERLTEFIRICTNTAKSGDFSLTSTCDSVLQKNNIEIGQFYVENQIAIESLIYPYTIPSQAVSSIGQDSSKVIGSENSTQLVNHATTGYEYGIILGKVLDECATLSSQYDMDSIHSCIGIAKSLNEKFKKFNTNAQLEFEKVLALGGLDKSPSETFDFDSP